MCTQVGVGGLVVGYTIVGAFGFMYIETMTEGTELSVVQQRRNACAEQLWKVAAELNTFNESLFARRANNELLRFQDDIVQSVKRGYNGLRTHDLWTFPAALMFSLSIITMIG